ARPLRPQAGPAAPGRRPLGGEGAAAGADGLPGFPEGPRGRTPPHRLRRARHRRGGQGVGGCRRQGRPIGGLGREGQAGFGALRLRRHEHGRWRDGRAALESTLRSASASRHLLHAWPRRRGLDSQPTIGGLPMTRRSHALVVLAALFLLVAGPATSAEVAPRPALEPDTILYGAAYYHEYMPYERLEKDVELMKRAGISVVRVGESTWTSWEPREGEFQFAWMDRVVDAMHAAGIQVVMGTPTYSIPPWLYAKHPEVMVIPLGQVRTPREFYGMRQNMDISHPVYRQYCERVIRKIAERYAKHPGVIGWQIDNETGAYGTAGPNVQAGFKEWLKRKFGTGEALNQAWGLVYWGQLLGSWDELPPRDGILNPGWKLEWERYQPSLVTDFLGWQAKLVREYAPARQWVTQDFHGATRQAVDSQQISKFL